jgi:pyrroline-5-carboxylate reductase
MTDPSGALARLKAVAFVGGGNMAEAIARGLLAAGMRPEQLRASDPLESRRTWLSGQLGIRTSADNAAVLEGADLAVLAVKPQHLGAATRGLSRAGRPLYLSIVAGATLASLRQQLGEGARVVRSMPNTPALIGAGISALATDPATDAEDLERAEAVLGAVGRVVRVPESLMDAVTGLSGSGPAYIYLFIEALTEAGLREGLPLATARELATWTALGAARMVAESGESPAALRERVTSPGGTTIAGLAALEAGGLRSALFAAVRAATQRSRELG